MLCEVSSPEQSYERQSQEDHFTYERVDLQKHWVKKLEERRVEKREPEEISWREIFKSSF